MTKIKPDKSLHFDEFPPVSTDDWEKVISQDLKGKDYKNELLWNTLDGINVLPFYRQDDLKNLAHNIAPVTTSAAWDIVEEIDIINIEKANEQALLALNNGATGLLFSLPASSVGSISDLSLLIKNIQIEHISLHFGKPLSTPEIIGWMSEICKDRTLDAGALNITFDFDPFARAVQSGKLIKKEALIKWYKEQNTPFKIFSVDAAFYGNCGGGIVQQLAFALAEANEYLTVANAIGKDILETASNIHFNFSTASHFFLEISKYRAFRIVWQQVLNAYENYLPNHSEAFIHAKTARWNKSFSDAHNNLIRATTETMSAALGGCSAVSVERFDKDFAEHSEFSARIARNIQLILQGEAFLDKVSDAGAGSYYIEVLTDSLVKESWKLFQEIEKNGGFYEAIREGFIQQQLLNSQYKRIESYKDQTSVLVGVNKYKETNPVQDSPKRMPSAKLKEQNASEFLHFKSDDYDKVDSVSEIKIEEALQHKKGVS